jgi:hypothetical protein
MHLRLVGAVEVDQDWPRFLGPRANNISWETGLLDKWPTNGLPLVWERRIGSGYSAPSVLKQRLVLHHRLADEEIVEAVHGELLIRQQLAGEPDHDNGFASGNA